MKGNRVLVLAYLQKRVNKAHFHEAKINFPQSNFRYLPHKTFIKGVPSILDCCTNKKLFIVRD